ncbi:universal stress protein [Nocardioides sp. MAHUQ-72]|uniref:universal stress protein n=1 Tax=unclassified Nocardioides TaxID=2615069 RepID=UPI003619C3AB
MLVAVEDEAEPAVRHAVEAAVRAGCPVHVLHVVDPGDGLAAHADGERLLHDVALRAEGLAEGQVTVSTELAHAGPVVDVIVERAGRARQVVLQRHDGGRLTGPPPSTRPGSTCTEVALRATCPVVLVPGTDRTAPAPGEGTPGLDVTPVLPGVLP